MSLERRRRRFRQTRSQGAVHDRRAARHEPYRRLPRGDADAVGGEQLPRRRRLGGGQVPARFAFALLAVQDVVHLVVLGIDPVAAEHAEPGELPVRRAHRLERYQPVLGGDDPEVEDGPQRRRVRRGEAQLVPEGHREELGAPEPVLQAHRRIVPERAHLLGQRQIGQVVVLREDIPETHRVVLQQTLLLVLRDRAHRAGSSMSRG